MRLQIGPLVRQLKVDLPGVPETYNVMGEPDLVLVMGFGCLGNDQQMDIVLSQCEMYCGTNVRCRG